MDEMTPGSAAGATLPAAPAASTQRKGKRPHEVEAIRFDSHHPECWLVCTCGVRLDARSAASLETAYIAHSGRYWGGDTRERRRARLSE